MRSRDLCSDENKRPNANGNIRGREQDGRVLLREARLPIPAGLLVVCCGGLGSCLALSDPFSHVKVATLEVRDSGAKQIPWCYLQLNCNPDRAIEEIECDDDVIDAPLLPFESTAWQVLLQYGHVLGLY